MLSYGTDYADQDQWADHDGTVHTGHEDVANHDTPRGTRERGTRDLRTPGGQLVTLADVTPERVTWLWQGRLPAGKLIVLDGDPSLGKSTLGLTFAAHVSTGTQWPDGAPCALGDVVLMSAEDGLADTVRPRLDAAGGNPARVHALTEVRYVAGEGKIGVRPPTLADVDILRDLVVRVHARLLIVDVLMAYLPKSDAHRDQDMRAVLHPVAALAEETGCSVLFLRHLNKATGGSAMYRGGGSIGIIGAARAAFVVAPDPDDETGETRVLASTKSNLAVAPPAMTYRLESAPESHVARVVWLGESSHRADSLLASTAHGDEKTERDEAVEWLTNYLADEGGVAKAGDVIKAAARDGIAKTTLTRARQRAGVTTEKAGFGGGWLWRIDEHEDRRDHEGTEGSTSPGLGSSDSSVDSSHPIKGDQPI